MGDYSVMAVATTLVPVRLRQLLRFLLEVYYFLWICCFISMLVILLWGAEVIGWFTGPLFRAWRRIK